MNIFSKKKFFFKLSFPTNEQPYVSRGKKCTNFSKHFAYLMNDPYRNQSIDPIADQ